MRTEAAQDGGGPPQPHLVRRLTLFDSIMLVVSGTIGPSIFIIPADVLRAVPNPGVAMLLWIAAGAITLLAALACAELGGMFPEAGGQYVFMREAYGGFTAFLYGWVLFTAGNSAALASMGIAVALFLGQAVPALAADHVLLAGSIRGVPFRLEQGSVVAVAAVIALTTVNLMSVKLAAWVQNLTALAYVVAVLAIVAIGFLFGAGSWSHFNWASVGAVPVSAAGIGVAMIPLFYCYDGWEFLSWVGGEIKNPRRNLPLALIGGVLLVIVTYLLANAIFLYALAPSDLAHSTTPAAAAMRAMFSADIGRWLALFIAIISFGSASVVTLGGARIYYSMAKDGAFFRAMTRLHPRWKTPSTSLIAQGVWVCVLILSSRYDQLYTCFIFMMTLTYAMTVGAVLVLRRTQPDRARPYRCFGYPWLPMIYLIVALSFVISTLIARPLESLTGLALAALGVPLYLHWRRNAAAGHV
ncbi:MAG TPA: amino acid permease [Steroidobacteraceae bacterium]|nr:amino acid permease [Steroidobacteraceae bacterium]